MSLDDGLPRGAPRGRIERAVPGAHQLDEIGIGVRLVQCVKQQSRLDWCKRIDIGGGLTRANQAIELGLVESCRGKSDGV